jgi:hypothetical protein
MEVGGGPVLRAVLRQLSTAAAIRTLPTPCRARAQGAIRRGVGGDRTPPLGVFLGLHEAVPAWGERMSDAGSEVWDLDDGFALPPPLLELGVSEFGGQELAESIGTSMTDADGEIQGQSPCQSPQQQMLYQMLVDSLDSQQVLLPLASAVLIGGRRFPQARPGRVAVGPGGSRWMRFRQQRRGPSNRQAAQRGPAGAPVRRQPPQRR